MTMPRVICILLTTLTLAAITGCKDETSPAARTSPAAAQTQPAAKPAATPVTDADFKVTHGVAPNAQLANTTCPVSGEALDRQDTTLTAIEYQGKTYGLCCPDCIDLFKKDPAKYLAKLNAPQAPAVPGPSAMPSMPDAPATPPAQTVQ